MAIDDPQILETLERLQPDLIVTQDLCDVCAISFDEVERAVKKLSRSEVVPGLRHVEG